MKILIDIGHPADVHQFKYFTKEMQSKGHSVIFTVRDKEFEIELLKKNEFTYFSFGKKPKKIIGKIFGLIKFNLMLLKVALKNKPDVYLSHGSMYAAQVAWVLRKPHISFEDTFNFEQIHLYKPFSSVILTSDYEHPNMGKNNLKYRGYHELAYLHPNRFEPDKKVLNELNINDGEKYCIVRFVSWEATHDLNLKGITLENKRRLVTTLSKYTKVFISSEKPLPEDLVKYKFPLSSDRMHDAMAFSSLIFGESATMVAEGAVLGVPGIYLDDIGRYYTNDLEKKYGLVYNYTCSTNDQTKAIDKAENILEKVEKEEYIKRREKMLRENIDVTNFLVWFIENYPNSVSILKENPNYQLKFAN